ncbi:MAG: hypothetical protein IJB38_08335 [Bacteroidales bacterium]|nr:hypothetical protein [Bacteroidales bacterium]
MKNKDIESILRDSRPQVQDNPTFLLEVQQKMRAVEGIKNEVDRQRRYGRTALILALVSGLILGAVAMSLTYLYPMDTTAISDGILSDIRVFLESYRQYLLLPIAGCAISLGVIFGRHKNMFVNS